MIPTFPWPFRILCAVLLAWLSLLPRDASAQLNVGSDFIFGFEYPGLGPFELSLAPDAGTATVQVEYPVGTPVGSPVTLPAGASTIVTLPTTIGTNWSNGTVQANAVRVYSLNASEKFSCTLACRLDANSTSATVLPVPSLGTTYRAITVASDNHGAYGGQFVVVATQDNTQVTMTPTAALVSGEAAGIPIQVTLNRGEGWVAALAHDGDLTGSLIASDKPVEVTNGAPSNYFGPGAADGMLQVAQPISTWGTYVPVADLPGYESQGVTYKVVAAENGTTILQDGVAIATLDAGQFREVTLAGNHWFQGKQGGGFKPIFVALLMPGGATFCTISDPDMCNMIPASQYTTDHIFYTVGDGQYNCHFATIIARNQDTGLLKLDGVVLGSGDFSAIGSSGYSVATVALSQGSHVTESTLGHAVTVEGYGLADSYMYPAGSSAPPGGASQPPILVPPSDMTVTEQYVADQTLEATDGDGEPLTFGLSSSPSFATVTTSSAGTGTATGDLHLAPTHPDVGTYPGTITVSDGTLSDDRSITITVLANVAPVLAIIPDPSVPGGGTGDQGLSATDANGTPLAFTLSQGPAFASVTTTDPGTGTASGSLHMAPVLADVGTHSAEVTVSDGFLDDSQSFTITVLGNVAPSLVQPPAISLTEETVLDQGLQATDANSDPVTFSLQTGPSFATVTTTAPGTGTATGSLHLTPGASDVGTYSATISVSDGSLSDAKSTTITVLANAVDASRSYFVPESGSFTAPTQGAPAITNARRCPNDDGTQVLRLNARLKVVVFGTNTKPMANVSAADICVLFNGGTAAQGFTGTGDDSIIANSQYNPLAACPDVRCVQADKQTDVNGITYITWIGSTYVSGNATRDPLRKWGGYAGDIPVTVLGTPLRGKLAETGPGSVLGSYTAHVKSTDHVGGGTTALNQGELVNQLDVNPVQVAIGKPYVYRYDFDNNGTVNTADLNFIKAHNNHRCNNPQNP